MRLVAVMDASPSDQLIYGPDAWHTLVIILTHDSRLLPFRQAIEEGTGLKDFKLKKWSLIKSDKTRIKIIKALKCFPEYCEIYARSAREREIIFNERKYINRLGVTGNWTDCCTALGERQVILKDIFTADRRPGCLDPIHYSQSRIILWMADTIIAIRDSLIANAKNSQTAFPEWSLFTDLISGDTKRTHPRLKFLNGLLAGFSGLSSVMVSDAPCHDDLADIVAGALSSLLFNPNTGIGIAAREWAEWGSKKGNGLYWLCPEFNNASDRGDLGASRQLNMAWGGRALVGDWRRLLVPSMRNAQV